MSDRTRDATSVPLPLEVLLPAVVSVLVVFVLSSVLVHHIYLIRSSQAKRLTNSSSLLLLSDREANRQWLDDLRLVKGLGLGWKAKRTCSLSLDVKCRGEGDFEDEFIQAPLSRPQGAFFPEWRRHSSILSDARRMLNFSCTLQSSLSLFGWSTRTRSDMVIPEIQITVPPTAVSATTSLLPQHRRWSSTFRHDIGLATSVIPQLKKQDQHADTHFMPLIKQERTYAPVGSPIGETRIALPSVPCRPVFASPRMVATDTDRIPWCRTPLSPISEEQGSRCSSASSSSTVVSSILDDGYKDNDNDKGRSTSNISTSKTERSLVSSYGLALLQSSHSLFSTTSTSTDLLNMKPADHPNSAIYTPRSQSEVRLVAMTRPLASKSTVALAYLDSASASSVGSASTVSELSYVLCPPSVQSRTGGTQNSQQDLPSLLEFPLCVPGSVATTHTGSLSINQSPPANRSSSH
ncbi:uncharacterized protein FOMMEDRAFT_157118 [Fomitiporia mediterranea MF3/22]|uniref:uncharacterized protein n=1 Tax=Fomitiporia mediterranea (strain MF3/22) TaxID=694068 RepID=UPI0004409687|nr:uncharacterized protein FOMMEDRAFT_157118 [Fomitiporia mediterranea MF3/22]EJD01976.1 hypothetical protein FOMMEDRAFT_157118 [Fomitiporia mediterranea MF3/22]